MCLARTDSRAPRPVAEAIVVSARSRTGGRGVGRAGNQRAWWRLLLMLPATAAASGFLQARFRFCSGFSRVGVFNFGPLGQTHQVADEQDRAQDRRRGNQVTLYSAIIGTAFAVISVFIG